MQAGGSPLLLARTAAHRAGDRAARRRLAARWPPRGSGYLLTAEAVTLADHCGAPLPRAAHHLLAALDVCLLAAPARSRRVARLAIAIGSPCRAGDAQARLSGSTVASLRIASSRSPSPASGCHRLTARSPCSSMPSCSPSWILAPRLTMQAGGFPPLLAGTAANQADDRVALQLIAREWLSAAAGPHCCPPCG